MTHIEINQKLSQLILNERKITHEILQLINLALEGRTYLELGFSSMFDWLVSGFGYSSSAAFRRIEAAKLLRSVPEVEQKLKSGTVNLSTLSKAQTAIRQHEKISGHQLSIQQKQQTIDNIENKTAVEAERELFKMYPEAASTTHQNRRQIINENITRYSINLNSAASQNLQRAKELLSHQFPQATDTEIISFALEFLIQKTDPLKKTTADTAVKSYTGQRRLIIQRAQSRCTYRDSQTGKICGSSHQIEIDHIHPRALGGSDDPSNLRVLCRQHNLLMAEKTFGRPLIQKYRSSSEKP